MTAEPPPSVETEAWEDALGKLRQMREERELAEEHARMVAERARAEPFGWPPEWPEPFEPYVPQPAIVMRIRFKKLGGHYHCRVFTARHVDQTFATNGDLVFDEAEWPDIQLLMRGAEFFEETTGWP